MHIITRTDASVEMQDWRQILASSFRNIKSLLDYLEISSPPSYLQELAAQDFPLLVPEPFARLMEKGNPEDPLLLQVLPQNQETEAMPGYVTDPLEEKDSNVKKGIIHKYHGRVLLLAATGCAVNCRYCFRRHFSYDENRLGRKEWHQALDYVRNDNSIAEVILSGGDPLILQDKQLFELINEIEAIPHVERLRIHSRLPVVIPQRLTHELAHRLKQSRLYSSLVLHINHPNELSDELRIALIRLRDAGTHLLNQSVLLQGVNNQSQTLIDLSNKLFRYGILPYYIHLFDQVAGAHHFDINQNEALKIYDELKASVSGYLLPKLVKEIPNEPNKTHIYVQEESL